MKFTGIKDKEFESKILEVAEGYLEKAKAGLSDENKAKLEGYLDKIEIEFSRRLAVCAGKAFTQLNLIKLNYRLFKANPDELQKTFGHELAHLLAYQIHGPGVHHCYRWQKIMISIGLPAERCHNLDVSEFRRKAKRYTYHCGCKAYQLSTQRHRKNLERPGRYFCGKCKGKLSYIGPEDQVNKAIDEAVSQVVGKTK